MAAEPGRESHEAPPGAEGKRLDAWLAELLAPISRHQVQLEIKRGGVEVNGRAEPARYRLAAGDRVNFPAVLRTPAARGFLPSQIDLDIVREDESLLVVNKPAGLVVHPAAGHTGGTLANALLARCGPSIQNVGGENRCGIVHRLDRQTTGLLLAAKTDEAHAALSAALAERRVGRVYIGVALGKFKEAEGRIDRRIGRRISDRKLMGVTADGRPARTLYRVLLHGDGLALLLLRLHTGRTHQIRVHLQSVGRPILGDPEYGYTKARSLQGLGGRIRAELRAHWPERQMLHAAGLRFEHPESGEMIFEYAPPAPDMDDALRRIFPETESDLRGEVMEELTREEPPEELEAEPEPAAAEEDTGDDEAEDESSGAEEAEE